MTAPTKTLRLDSDVAAILEAATITGPRLDLPAGQLDRQLYARVDKALKLLGAKWSRRDRCHLADDDGLADRLAQALDAGGVTVEKLGWFPTPAPVVDRLLELAAVEPDHLCLEPSAGGGAIAGRLLAIVGPDRLTVVEIDPGRCAALSALGIKEVYEQDFSRLLWGPQFQRVVMNPPFERQADVAHVRRAYGMLAPGGRLVSVISNRYGTGDFISRDELPDLASMHVEQNDPDAFKPSGTAVRTCNVVLERKP